MKSARAEANSLKSKLAEAEKQNRANADALKEVQKQLAAEKRTGIVDRLLATGRLPESWRADIRKRLIEAKDETEMEAILDEEIKKASSVPKPLAVRGGGASVSPGVQQSKRGGVLSTVAESLGASRADLVTAVDYNDFVRRKYGSNH